MRADGPVRRPLSRKPKHLDGEPSVFAPSASGDALVTHVPERSGRRAPAGGSPRVPARSTQTAEEAVVVPLPQTPAAIDPEVRARAVAIAARLAVRRPRSDVSARRGSGALASVPYRGGSDDVDLDRTLEVLAERPVPEPEDIVVRERLRTRRSVVLLVDVSGSMRGERVRTAAAAVGALAAELGSGGDRDDRLGVVAFWSDAAVLLPLGRPVHPLRLLETLLRLPAQGLTNIAFPLELARRQLVESPVRDARALLLSDCVHNAGPDPRPVAGRLPRLDVLLDTTGEHDLELARDFARAGRGRLRRIRHHRDVAPALGAIFRP